MNSEIIEALRALSEQRAFDAGAALRLKGGFSPEMLIVLEGEVKISLTRDGDAELSHTIGRNSVIGEIGFLTGKGATADATALTAVRALAIDRDVLSRLEVQSPKLAAEFSRYLARIAKARLKSDEMLLGEMTDDAAAAMEIILCATPDLMRTAQRVRYDVYCGEFGRPSQYADHDAKTIIDDLDTHGTSLLAVKEGEAVGTSRVNFTRDGSLGMLPEIYGMATSKQYPKRACVITKYAIRGDHRGGPTYIKLFGAMATFITQSDIKEIFIDCVPPLARFYATMGFKQCGEEFIHYENGLSVPMVLDVVAYNDKMPVEERYRKNRWRW
ncbi:MAG: cyclic nucleotide-binding domain-containing protein [Hyphomicrobiaceae bacterium]